MYTLITLHKVICDMSDKPAIKPSNSTPISALELQPGNLAQIIGFKTNNDRAYRQSLLAMGLIPGARLQVLRAAPLGDPLHLRVAGHELSLRRHELDLLTLRLITD